MKFNKIEIYPDDNGGSTIFDFDYGTTPGESARWLMKFENLVLNSEPDLAKAFTEALEAVSEARDA
jgi:hypothetical protein